MKKMRLILAVFSICASMPLLADPITLDAISLDPIYGDFSITFDDDGDGLLEWDEILSFSGLIAERFGPGFLLHTVIQVPDIVGISIFSIDPAAPNVTGGENLWAFLAGLGVHGQDNFGIHSGNWRYTLQEVDGQSVPEPGSLVLLGIGLFGMWLARRRISV